VEHWKYHEQYVWEDEDLWKVRVLRREVGSAAQYVFLSTSSFFLCVSWCLLVVFMLWLRSFFGLFVVEEMFLGAVFVFMLWLRSISDMFMMEELVWVPR
jgi:hypothetical protein